MKILHTVQSYYPDLGGMPELVRQVSERLAKRGHEVTIVTSFNSQRKSLVINNVKVIQFKVEGNFVTGIKGETKKYVDFIKKSDFDIIVNWAGQQWATDLVLPELKFIKSKKASVLTGFSSFYKKEYQEYYNKMKEWIKDYDINFFSSNNYRDINFSRECGNKNNIVVPNGADQDEFESSTVDFKKKFNIPKNKRIIFHLGSLTGAKGQEEAIEIFLKARLRNTVLVFAGKGTNELLGYYGRNFRYYKYPKLKHFYKSDIITLGALEREDIVAAYNSANLFLFPSNIECSPIVVIECLASKTPFLITDVGNSVELVKWTNGGEIMSTQKNYEEYSSANINESSKQLRKLFLNKEKLDYYSENGYKAFLERFTWDKVVDRYEENYLSIIN